MKNLVPFGNYLKSSIENNQFPSNDVYLFIGERAWELGRDFQIMRKGTLCLPPESQPTEYEWPVLNFDILIFDTSLHPEYFIENLVAVLFSYGANIVRYVSLEGLLTVYKKEL